MRHSTFFWFMLPSGLAMLLFIGLPIVSVILQSLHAEHEQVLIVTENCGPFGCTETTQVDADATAALIAETRWAASWALASSPTATILRWPSFPPPGIPLPPGAGFSAR